MLKQYLERPFRMLHSGTILPPVPILWQGNLARTSALRGQPALLFFPCGGDCRICDSFFQQIQASDELDYWSIRTLKVLPRTGKEPATDSVVIDLDGRCRALATSGDDAPALAVFDACQEFRGTFPWEAHRFPDSTEVETLVRSALGAGPG